MKQLTTYVAFAAAALATFALLTAFGCAGHGGGAGQGMHAAAFKLQWPVRSRVIPRNTDYVLISASTKSTVAGSTAVGITDGLSATSNGNALNGTVSNGALRFKINNPNNGGTSNITLSGLPLSTDDTDIYIDVEAYADPAVLLAAGSTRVTISSSGPPAAFTVRLDSAIDHVEAIVDGTAVVLPSANPVTLSVASTSSVQFKAYADPADAAEVLLNLSDLQVTTSGNLLVEGGFTKSGKDTVTIAPTRVGSGSLVLSSPQNAVFSPQTLDFDIQGFSLAQGATISNEVTDAIADVTADGTKAYGLFDTVTDTIGRIDLISAEVNFTGLFNLASAPTTSGRLTIGGTSPPLTMFEGKIGDSTFINVASPVPAINPTGTILDLDSRDQANIYALTKNNAASIISAFTQGGASTGSNISLSNTNGTNLAVAFRAETAPAGTRPTVKYVSSTTGSGINAHWTVKRYKDNSTADSTLSFASGIHVTDISADGLVLYVLESTGAGNGTVYAFSWDGSEITTFDLSSLIGNAGTPLRIVARGGTVYVAIKNDGGNYQVGYLQPQ